ncbi:MAG: pyruvate formate lyase family protein [Flavonifractor plautii]
MMAANERVSRLRERMLVTPAICVERAYYMTKSYQKTENLPTILRRAHALADILDHMTIRIEEGELIAGWQTSKERGGALLIEMRCDWIMDELDSVQCREWDKYQPLSEEEKAMIREIVPYWQGKTLSDYWLGAVPHWAAKLENVLQTGGFCRNGHHQAHSVGDYESILKYGLRATLDLVEKKLSSIDPFSPEDLDRYHFYQSVKIVQEAVIRHAHRYADLGEKMANEEPDPVRRAELKELAANCRHVPEHPARTFREAIQSIWLVFVPLMIECWGAGMSLGRVDQYYPLSGRFGCSITRDEVLELASLLLIKLNAAIN